MNTNILEAYSTTTSILGFGLHSAARLLSTGLTWSQIHALTDAGLIRVDNVHWGMGGNHSVIYRLLFP